MKQNNILLITLCTPFEHVQYHQDPETLLYVLDSFFTNDFTWYFGTVIVHGLLLVKLNVCYF